MGGLFVFVRASPLHKNDADRTSFVVKLRLEWTTPM